MFCNFIDIIVNSTLSSILTWLDFGKRRTFSTVLWLVYCVVCSAAVGGRPNHVLVSKHLKNIPISFILQQNSDITFILLIFIGEKIA